VTFEGPEGAGKTTQAARLRDVLEAAGIATVLLREPGGTPLGEAIRTLLLEDAAGSARITPRTDALLFSAARAQLVADRIEPALASGTTVICSRFADSTLAYQGAGMGLPAEQLRTLERFATGGRRPDLTMLLDLPAEVGLARKGGVEETRFESSFDIAFHQRVRQAFLALAAAEPDRFVIVDATRGSEDVFAAVRAAVERRLRVELRPGAADAPASPRRPSETTQSEPNGRPVRITR
jgi:dTMP kinase